MQKKQTDSTDDFKNQYEDIIEEQCEIWQQVLKDPSEEELEDL